MSSGTDAGPPEPEGLQFDQAEFEQGPPSAVTCAACKREILDQYFKINGTIVCGACKEVIDTRLRGGSGLSRFLRAIAFGTGAATVGTLAYALFIRVTNVDLSLISIFVGYLIGRAVRAGSRGLGGLSFQLLAVGLTYLAIGATHSVLFLASIELPAAPAGVRAPAPANPAGPAPAADPQPAPLRRADFLVLAVALTRLAVMIPVLMARESVISIAIVGFALWQAWKMNVRAKFVVTGPYRMGEDGRREPIGGMPAHA